MLHEMMSVHTPTSVFNHIPKSMGRRFCYERFSVALFCFCFHCSSFVSDLYLYTFICHLSLSALFSLFSERCFVCFHCLHFGTSSPTSPAGPGFLLFLSFHLFHATCIPGRLAFQKHFKTVQPRGYWEGGNTRFVFSFFFGRFLYGRIVCSLCQK
jgi:hypothetical protein